MFHVPETARMTEGPMATKPFEGDWGTFVLESPEPGWHLYIIANGAWAESDGWEHVSVHARSKTALRMRTPTWKEMHYVKGVFWDGEDVVAQLHPRASEYVNKHPHVLHLWRNPEQPFPTPPASLVG